MKFFTQELCDMIGSNNEEVSRQADEMWNHNIKLYQEQFDKVKKLLTKKFLDIYLKNNEFHDYYFVGEKIIRTKYKKMPFVDFKINISNGLKKYEIIYKSVSRLNILANYINEDCDYLGYKEGVIDSWSYDEFDTNKDNQIVHEILFLSGTTFKIECSHIIIKKIN